jgi:hypothetical protein
MNLGVTLKAAEKAFGPALPGSGAPEHTLSAVPYAAGKGKKFAGVMGVRENARFYIHFPTPIDWNLLKSKKGIPDFINNLSESGPQGEQGREALVSEFMARYDGLQTKLRQKQEAAKKKATAAKRKEELVGVRQRLAPCIGEQQATLTIGSETVSLTVTITVDKKGKMKIVASL